MPEQNYANHRRYLAPWHFFAMPVIAIYTSLKIVRIFDYPGWAAVWEALVAVAFLTALGCARWMALRVQDRVVRLEERLRLERLLPGRRADIERLRTRQLIGLRFASDEEVPALVERVLAGELTGSRDVKKEVRQWRPDFLRV